MARASAFCSCGTTDHPKPIVLGVKCHNGCVDCPFFICLGFAFVSGQFFLVVFQRTNGHSIRQRGTRTAHRNRTDSRTFMVDLFGNRLLELFGFLTDLHKNKKGNYRSQLLSRVATVAMNGSCFGCDIGFVSKLGAATPVIPRGRCACAHAKTNRFERRHFA